MTLLSRLDALEAARAKGCAGTWVVTSKDEPFASGRAIASFGGDYTADDDKERGNMSDSIGLAALDRGDVGNEYSSATEDAVCAATAVNLAPSLSAIARAAVARPWWRQIADQGEWAPMDFRACRGCEKSWFPRDGAPTHKRSNGNDCPFAEIDAAIDAAEGTA